MPNNEIDSSDGDILARGGGNATAAGVGFQSSLGAAFASQLIAERIVHNRLGLGNARIRSLRFETEAPVDDILIETDQGGYIFIQAKTVLTLSSQAGSELGKVADQLVRLWLTCIRGTGGRGWDRPLRRGIDLALLVVGPDSSATILTDLTRALTAIQATGSAPLPQGPQKALDRLSSLTEQAWTKIEGERPTSNEVDALLKQIAILPFDPEGPDRTTAQETLAHVLKNADDAGGAFIVLAQECEKLMKGRLGADVTGFRRALAAAQIPVLAPPSFVADVNQLRSYSQGIERQLTQYEETKVGTDEIKIDRPCTAAVTTAAIEDSLLLIGEPGAGKSAVVSSAARELRQQNYEVIELAVDRLPVESREGLSRELGLSNSVISVLTNWPGNGPAFLFIDALDATRGGRSEAVFRTLIGDVLALPERRWRVVASIRTFDLRLGQQFRELFEGSVPNRAFSDPAFLDVRHVHIPPWSESELNDFLARAPKIATAIAAGGPRLRELAQVPFNTRLLADLISGGVEPRAFGEINSQVELLALYWSRRVIGIGSSAEICLEAAVSEMIQKRALRAPKLAVARVNSEALDRLLAVNVLVPLGQEQQFISFRHHILFDYAASRLYLRLDDLDATLALLERDRGLGLMLAPALAFALRGLWFDGDGGRGRFWGTVTCFAGEVQCDPIVRSVAARTASELPRLPEDARGLIEALDDDGAQQERATRAFGQIVGALAVRADDKEPITVGLWCEVAAGAASHVSKVLWPLRTLIFLLMERTESDAQRQQVGYAARTVLTFGLDHPNTPSQLIAGAIDFVAATYASDIDASRALLRRLFQPDHFAAHADQELPWLARKIAPISAVDPEFVVEIYAAVFTGWINDTSETSIGGSQILPLRSNRRQDYDMARFSLKEYFPHFLESWPGPALTALQRAITGYIALEHPIPDTANTWTISAGDRQAGLREDLSHIWAWDPDEEHANNTVALLKAFVSRLRSAEPAIARSMVEHIIRHNDVAVIWARTFLIAAERPEVIGDLLWPLATQAPFLQCADTIKDTVDFIASRYRFEPESERERFERFALSFDFSWSKEPEKAKAHFFQRLFGRIGSTQLASPESRSFMAALPASPKGPAAENRRPFMTTSEWVSEPNPYWWLSQAGVDVEEPQNASLLRESDEIKTALGLEPQATEPLDPVGAVASLKRFQENIRSASVAAEVGEYANEILGRGVAKVTGLPDEQLRANSDAVREIVPLIEYLVALPTSPVRADAEEKFEKQASWSPSPRNAAAQSIMHLMHFDASYVAPFRSTVETLLTDPEPAIRLQVAERLTSLWVSDQPWMWQLADGIAHRETNCGILKYFANYFLAGVVHHTTERVEELSFVINERGFPRGEAPTDALREEIGSLIALLWISHDRVRARHALETWLTDAPSFERELSHAIHMSREALVLKYRGDDERDAGITRRAQELAAWIVEATATGIEAYLASTNPSEAEQKRVGIFTKLLNNMSDQFYFASGSFQEHQGKTPALATKEAKTAFFQDNFSTLRRIADAGTPATIFHLIELFEFLIPADPPGVFDLVAHALLGAGKRHGFQFESLGADRFVGVVGRFLADYRSLFADDERRQKLIACLDAFMEAGWPAARRLLYRLPDVLQ